jgi:uncharacterized membrane protein
MAELVCVAFDDRNTADKVLNELQAMQKEHLVELADACVVIRDHDGTVRLKQSVNLIAGGTVGGGAMGALWGSLIGLLFMNPLAGMLVGTGIGAATGAISGALSDYGIDDDFIKRLGASINPGGSALFVLVRRANVDKVLPRLGSYRGTVLHTSLSDDQERRLRAALAKALEPQSESKPAA